MAFLALAIIPMNVVEQNQEALLSYMRVISGGSWLSALISVDATLVFSGTVLTSFTGVSGLAERITLDRVLPPFLLKKNKRGGDAIISGQASEFKINIDGGGDVYYSGNPNCKMLLTFLKYD